MHRITCQFSFRIIMILFIVCLTAPYCYPQGELGSDCDGQISRQPPNINLDCSGWFIRLFTRSGKVWGRINGKTREEVQQELERSRALDHRAFPNSDHWAYENPSEPICDMCDPQATSAKSHSPAVCSRTSMFGSAPLTINPDGSVVHNAEYFCQGGFAAVAEWGGKVGRTLPGLLGKLERPNPFGDVMSVFGPYIKSLGDVARRVKELNEKLRIATDLTEIAEGMRDIEREGAALDSSYNGLPRNARDWLEGNYRPSVAGLWIGPIWPGDSQPQGMQIIQNGDLLKVYLPGTNNLLFQGTLVGNEFTTPASRMPTELSASEVNSCGLSSNVLYANVSMRATVSADGRSLTLEQVTEKVTVGNCVFGGVIPRGTWYKK